MNKYIRKCLLVYISMATILCGMVGVTYAITATDADQYVTRSQYAVDMAHLQNKLDEAEAGLMGSINRFRSTNVKFVTWDTPNKYYTGTAQDAGKHNGGNYALRVKASGGTSSWEHYGYSRNSNDFSKKDGRAADLLMWRLYNGNYYIGRNMLYIAESSTNIYYYQGIHFAVPCENFPGWYLVLQNYHHYSAYQAYYFALVKLDPTVTSTPQSTDTLLFRFKKDLFVYNSDGATKLTTTKTTYSSNVSYYLNNVGCSPLGYCIRLDATSSGSQPIYFESWLDAETNDYMMTIRGMNRCYANSGSQNYNYTYLCTHGNSAMTKLIPSDNVEYVSGNTTNYIDAYSESASRYLIPIASTIGTGWQNDVYWNYEFVDCENGIRYWHAHRPAVTANVGSNAGKPVGVHYQIAILY